MRGEKRMSFIDCCFHDSTAPYRNTTTAQQGIFNETKSQSLGFANAPVSLALGLVGRIYVVQRAGWRRDAGLALALRAAGGGADCLPPVLGLVGQRYGSVSQFVRGPSSIRRYLQGSLTENEQPGHNPLGALMVIALIAAVLLQATTGLFAADENTFTDSGYLNHLVSSDTGSLMRKIHVNFFNLLAALAGLHIVTVLAYKFLKKKDLIRPMISGYKYIEGQTVTLKFASAAKLIAALAVAAVAVAAILMLK